MKFSLILLIILISSISFASNDKVFSAEQLKALTSISSVNIDTNSKVNINKTKAIAVTLAITLGIFGVHRLYLGTKPIVPISYTLTLGGGMGLLPIIDIFYIISAKDINQITNNDFIFMWNKKLVTSP